ncbi:MAG TPA: helix-turn-helix transcriptional regulator [Burkholderiales bacterium]|nr:helix-turn-helix transcriptional regulator [Burkholderiales bacterium]
MNVRELRHHAGLNQTDFWKRVGVTQSGGSRYENGRTMPAPVRELVRLVYVEKVDLAKVRGDDSRIVELLKRQQPKLYAGLRSEARKQRR